MSDSPDTSVHSIEMDVAETVTPITRRTVAEAHSASMASQLGTALQAAMREVFRAEEAKADPSLRSEPAA